MLKLTSGPSLNCVTALLPVEVMMRNRGRTSFFSRADDITSGKSIELHLRSAQRSSTRNGRSESVALPFLLSHSLRIVQHVFLRISSSAVVEIFSLSTAETAFLRSRFRDRFGRERERERECCELGWMDLALFLASSTSAADAAAGAG